jgi:hypothetical protein
MNYVLKVREFDFCPQNLGSALVLCEISSEVVIYLHSQVHFLLTKQYNYSQCTILHLL